MKFDTYQSRNSSHFCSCSSTSGMLHLGVTYCPSTEEDSVEFLIKLVRVLSDPILLCRGQQDDPGEALWFSHLSRQDCCLKMGSFTWYARGWSAHRVKCRPPTLRPSTPHWMFFNHFVQVWKYFACGNEKSGLNELSCFSEGLRTLGLWIPFCAKEDEDMNILCLTWELKQNPEVKAEATGLVQKTRSQLNVTEIPDLNSPK
ncbi:uncharacterized protein LOC127480692 [Manacus candei]|uniref:uncharacterized protein LOC127480692 n=1 Tax=Manacus candei TaxID=415023 RepID=UPI0022263456|nr:uncharacterized protein LOC127480692 [Manacus candei]